MGKAAKGLLVNLSIVIVSLTIGMVIVEGGLRALDISYPSFFDLDLVRGNALHPGAEGWQRDEGEAYVTINSHGWRDREHELVKPRGTFRVAVLGDSFAEAMQVPQGDAFWSVLERDLMRCPAFSGQSVEVINFGISGHGTGQQLLTLRNDVWKFDPDLILLAFYPGNDVRNNSRDLEKSPYRPYFFYRDGELALDDDFKRLPDFRPERVAWIELRNDLINGFRILQVVRKAVNAVRSRAGPQIPDDGAELGINDMAFVPPTAAEWKEAWRVTEGLLSTMNREIRGRDAEFWIAILTSGIQVSPDAELRQRYMKRIGSATLDYPNQRIAAFANHANIPVVNLLDSFREFVSAKKVPLHGFAGRSTGHWNKEGHKLAGTVISRRLCEARK